MSLKSTLKRIIGETNILYLKKLIPTKTEREEFRRRKALYGTFITKGDLCFDVGANFGNRISPLLALGAKVVAVEPLDYCANYIQKKFGSRVDLIRKGLSDKIETRAFFAANAHTVSSFNEAWIRDMQEGRFRDSGVNWEKEGEIEMTTLDRLIETYGKPRFIKIDVEGFEHKVLGGLNQPVDILSFEYAVPEHLHIVEECMDHIGRIYADRAEFNFSWGESAVLMYADDDWKSLEEMKRRIHEEEFLRTNSGDIYVRKT